jgi:hypothetical protein
MVERALRRRFIDLQLLHYWPLHDEKAPVRGTKFANHAKIPLRSGV